MLVHDEPFSEGIPDSTWQFALKLFVARGAAHLDTSQNAPEMAQASHSLASCGKHDSQWACERKEGLWDHLASQDGIGPAARWL